MDKGKRICSSEATYEEVKNIQDDFRSYGYPKNSCKTIARPRREMTKTDKDFTEHILSIHGTTKSISRTVKKYNIRTVLKSK